MRVPDVFSALTVNVILAIFSMIMAVAALGLLAFVISRENQSSRDLPRFHPKDKIKRHESTVVDFRNPSTVPDHFLELNTLMFQKKAAKNNQILAVTQPLDISGMEKMMAALEDDKFASRALPPLPADEEDVEDNILERGRRDIESTSVSSSFVTDSNASDDDSVSTQSTEAPGSISDREDETVQGVYDDGSTVSYSRTKPMVEGVEKMTTLYDNCWLLKYTVSREAESTLIQVYADFESRYCFPDKSTLDVTVETSDKKITETFDLEKNNDNYFQVDLTQNGFSEVENEDIKVTCIVRMSQLICKERIGTNSNFYSSDRPHDVVLIVEGKKFYVHKAIVAVSSEFFDALFYRNNMEKDKKEFEIKDVKYTEFNELLELIYQDLSTKIDDSNVLYLLKLADRFIMLSVKAMCGTHLIQMYISGKKYSDMDCLELSDSYDLAHLQRACLERIHSLPGTEFKAFLIENRKRIRKLTSNTKQNLIYVA